jgi:hypothetical protein
MLNPPDDQADSDDTSTATKTKKRVICVPARPLGMVLDAGKRSAHAAKLLAIKAAHGDGFVLNERHVRRVFGVSRRAFQAGISHAGQAGALDRQSRGRHYASELPLNRTAAGYVRVPEELLATRSALLGFILVVNLSPHPVHPATAAMRIGVSAPGTVRKLVAQATELGAIACTRSGHSVQVARKGFRFELVKNDAVKNGPVKNAPTHRNKEDHHRKRNERTQSEEREVPTSSSTRAKAAARRTSDKRSGSETPIDALPKSQRSLDPYLTDSNRPTSTKQSPIRSMQISVVWLL